MWTVRKIRRMNANDIILHLYYRLAGTVQCYHRKKFVRNLYGGRIFQKNLLRPWSGESPTLLDQKNLLRSWFRRISAAPLVQKNLLGSWSEESPKPWFRKISYAPSSEESPRPEFRRHRKISWPLVQKNLLHSRFRSPWFRRIS